jgi:membrane-associated protease RseP (regulator of RpoE activity)
MEQPAVPIRTRSRRLWLHILLFLLTTWSALVSGAVWFAGVPPELAQIPLWQLPFTPAALVPSIPFAACLMAILFAHEIGHYLACRHYRVPATLPFFLPAPLLMFGTFGAVIRIKGAIPHRRALFDIAAAGPLAGFAVTVPVLLAGAVTGVPFPETVAGGYWSYGDSLLTYIIFSVMYDASALMVQPIFFAGWFGLFLTALNLFPVGQLDGGHVVYSISRKAHRLFSWGTIAALGIWMAYTTWTTRTPSVYSLWFVVLLLMRNRHPRLMFEGGRLGKARSWIAFALLVIFVIAFLPNPLSYVP